MEATTFDPSIAVHTLRTAKRVNIAAILISLCSRTWKMIIFPVIDFIADVMMFPFKLIVTEWKLGLLYIVMCIIGFFVLVNVSESIHLMNF